ncbi:DUF695 domain-containing protein [Marivirga arenosa]|uniref:DUF695 domain-containing protein n=1 Tax=Marivirga arenosa TaxID=3059076 RepID=A0AA49JD29_9BACT|nr:DUF695 domain-containing protein [Marivirga sp. BKB1-2]WKK82943.1 DUF695 domain-containing protein [Marivirga sp. BKB1-2]WKK82947.2 DUF695 domain-containing protein [Marivirga sp. BKB1-2]WKK82953.1 DUF695 domain-containing protein [Marivirga sp. BKB1-2]
MGIWNKLFGSTDKNSEEGLQPSEVRVSFPEEVFSTIEFNKDDLPGIGIITSSLKDFEHKHIFPWHLSIVLQYNELIENGMPSIQEREETDTFCEHLEELLKGENQDKPNGLFIGRFTWNGTREMIWKIHDPEIADKELKQIIDSGSHPRPFDYRMEEDPEWKLSKWHLME